MMRRGRFFIFGMVIGGVAVALLTPKTGKEMQKCLIKKADGLYEKLKNVELNDAKEFLSSKLDDSVESIKNFDWEESKTKVSEKFQELTEKMNDIYDQIGDSLNPIAVDNSEEDLTAENEVIVAEGNVPDNAVKVPLKEIATLVSYRNNGDDSLEVESDEQNNIEDNVGASAIKGALKEIEPIVNSIEGSSNEKNTTIDAVIENINSKYMD